MDCLRDFSATVRGDCAGTVTLGKVVNITKRTLPPRVQGNICRLQQIYGVCVCVYKSCAKSTFLFVRKVGLDSRLTCSKSHTKGVSDSLPSDQSPQSPG